jgi:hypothetical protein
MSGSPKQFRILVITDIHFACDLERARGDYESRTVSHPLLRFLLRQYRYFLWRRDPFGWNHYVQRFIERAGEPDCIIGNGDYCCDSAFIGVADDPSLHSSKECLGKIRNAFGEKFIGIIGDHDIGKKSMFGGFGGMHLDSWDRCLEELDLKPFFQVEFGRHVIMGLNSTLIGLPSNLADCAAADASAWEMQRNAHLETIRAALGKLSKDQRLLFFIHDPSALPHLAKFGWMREHFHRLDGTFVGHLHSEIIIKMSRMLAGMPRIHGLGHTALKMSTALQKAREWRPFKVHLVPAPGGIQISRRGGFAEILIPPDGTGRVGFKVHSLD